MLTSKFLDPKNDFAFKRIFGTEKNKDILIDFLNAVLGLADEERVVSVTFLKTNQEPEVASLKQSLVDVLCEDEEGRQYIIEMQVARVPGFEKRAQYYAAKAYVNQLGKGQAYENLKAIIFIAITDYIMFPDNPSYKSAHYLLEHETLERHLKDFSFTFIELPKFKKEFHELSDVMDRWVYFLKHADSTHEKDVTEIMGSDQFIARAYDELNRFSWSEIELRTYEAEEKRELDARVILEGRIQDMTAEFIESAHNKGLAKGVEEGIAQGITQGIAQGKAEGKAEGRMEALHDFAKNLLRSGDYTDSAVAKLTSLSPLDVNRLKESLSKLEHEKS